MSASRNDIETAPYRPAGLRPLDARSIALSALLGSHPPVLPGRSLVALAELFGIAPGTMRTALSRCAARGELDLVDGRYHLTGRLIDRQHAQDAAWRRPLPGWDGAWHTMIAIDGRRTLDHRRRARNVLVDHRFAELRPDIWMRPANLPAPRLGEAWAAVTGRIDRADTDLVDRLWDLDALDREAADLRAALRAALAPLSSGDPSAIAPAFHAAAAAVRLLRTDPLLPERLVPAGSQVVALRHDYAAAEAALQRALRAFHGTG